MVPKSGRVRPQLRTFEAGRMPRVEKWILTGFRPSPQSAALRSGSDPSAISTSVEPLHERTDHGDIRR
jgi:hypothetical protein